MKKVSICIPAYEQPYNLDKCLKSILKQTFKDYEVIITDDSKESNLFDIVEKYIEDMDIKYIKNTLSKGSPENWNKAISLATGKYIKILHHDDSFKNNNSLNKFIELIERNKDNKIVFCSSSHIDNNDNYLSSHILDKEKMQKIKQDPDVLIFGNVIGAPSTMMYENTIGLTFDNRMKWLVDIDFYIRLLRNNNFIYTQDELICINIGEEGRVTNACIDDKKINIYETMIMFKKFNFQYLNYCYKAYFLKFNITSFKDIKELGYTDTIHPELLKLLKYVVLLLPVYTILKKIKEKIRFS